MKVINVIDKISINEYREAYGWKGDGTEENPIIIDNDEILAKIVLFKTDDLHIQLKNIDIGVLIFEKCQNIIIEDSILSIIKIRSCKDVIIRDNIIIAIRISFSENVIVEHNRICTISNIRTFTILMIVVASISGLIFFLSYLENLYFLRAISVLVFVLSTILFFLDIIEKRNKFLINKAFKNNEFINMEKKTGSKNTES